MTFLDLYPNIDEATLAEIRAAVHARARTRMYMANEELFVKDDLQKFSRALSGNEFSREASDWIRASYDVLEDDGCVVIVTFTKKNFIRSNMAALVQEAYDEYQTDGVADDPVHNAPYTDKTLADSLAWVNQSLYSLWRLVEDYKTQLRNFAEDCALECAVDDAPDFGDFAEREFRTLVREHFARLTERSKT